MRISYLLLLSSVILSNSFIIIPSTTPVLNKMICMNNKKFNSDMFYDHIYHKKNITKIKNTNNLDFKLDISEEDSLILTISINLYLTYFILYIYFSNINFIS